MESEPKKVLTALAMISTSLFAIGGLAAGLSTPFYLGLTGVGMHYAWQIRNLDINNRENCWQRFKSNRYLGLLLTLAILAGKSQSNIN